MNSVNVNNYEIIPKLLNLQLKYLPRTALYFKLSYLNFLNS